MAFITDTYKAINFLQQNGYTKEQAKGFVEVVREFEINELTTKADLKELASNIENKILRTAMVQSVANIGLTVALVQLLLG